MASAKERSAPQGPHVITYSASLDVPAGAATLLTELLVAERRRRGTGRARAKSSDGAVTCADAHVARLQSGAESGPLHRQTDRQVALNWAGVECSPCRWRARRWLRGLYSARWPP